MRKNPLDHSVSSTSVRSSDCPVCFEQFSEEKNYPMQISNCGHSVCETCIEKCDNKCPTCRRPFNFPHDTKRNYALMGTIQAFNELIREFDELTTQFKNLKLMIRDLVSQRGLTLLGGVPITNANLSVAIGALIDQLKSKSDGLDHYKKTDEQKELEAARRRISQLEKELRDLQNLNQKLNGFANDQILIGQQLRLEMVSLRPQASRVDYLTQRNNELVRENLSLRSQNLDIERFKAQEARLQDENRRLRQELESLKKSQTVNSTANAVSSSGATFIVQQTQESPATLLSASASSSVSSIQGQITVSPVVEQKEMFVAKEDCQRFLKFFEDSLSLDDIEKIIRKKPDLVTQRISYIGGVDNEHVITHALFVAIVNTDFDVFKCLLAQGADPNLCQVQTTQIDNKWHRFLYTEIPKGESVLTFCLRLYSDLSGYINQDFNDLKDHSQAVPRRHSLRFIINLILNSSKLKPEIVISTLRSAYDFGRNDSYHIFKKILNWKSSATIATANLERAEQKTAELPLADASLKGLNHFLKHLVNQEGAIEFVYLLINNYPQLACTTYDVPNLNRKYQINVVLYHALEGDVEIVKKFLVTAKENNINVNGAVTADAQCTTILSRFPWRIETSELPLLNLIHYKAFVKSNGTNVDVIGKLSEIISIFVTELQNINVKGRSIYRNEVSLEREESALSLACHLLDLETIQLLLSRRDLLERQEAAGILESRRSTFPPHQKTEFERIIKYLRAPIGASVFAVNSLALLSASTGRSSQQVSTSPSASAGSSGWFSKIFKSS